MKLGEMPKGDYQVGLTNEQRAAKLIFLAGRHSQGNPRVEAQFIDQAVICHPSWTPETIDTELVNTLYTDFLIKLFDGGHHAHVDHFKIDTPRQANEAFSVFKDGIGWQRDTEYAAKVEMDRLVPWLINIDRKYLLEEGGRPQRVGHQAMRSYVCHYGLMAKPTGAWEYDGLYRAISSHVLAELHDDPTSWQSLHMRDIAHAHAAADTDPANARKLMGLIPFEAQGRNLFDGREPFNYRVPGTFFDEMRPLIALSRLCHPETPNEVAA